MIVGSETVHTCYACGSSTVIWDSSFNFDEMGYEGEGIVNMYHCTNCGADIEVAVGNE